MLRHIAAIITLLRSRQDISVTEVFRLLELPKSSAARLLKEMTQVGLLEQNPTNRRYRLGSVLSSIQQSGEAGPDLLDEAEATLRRLRDRFGHTCFVMGLEGANLTVLRTLEGTGPIRVHATPQFLGGVSFFRSPGRAILARRSDEEVRALYPASLRSTSTQSHTTVEGFLERLALVRRQGYAEGGNEGFPHVAGFAVAVAPPHQPPIALNICFVSGLPTADERRSIIAALMQAGRHLGQRFSDPVWLAASHQMELSQKSSA